MDGVKPHVDWIIAGVLMLFALIAVVIFINMKPQVLPPPKVTQVNTSPPKVPDAPVVLKG